MGGRSAPRCSQFAAAPRNGRGAGGEQRGVEEYVDGRDERAAAIKELQSRRNDQRGKPGQGKSDQGKSDRGKSGQGKSRQGKSRQGKSGDRRPQILEEFDTNGNGQLDPDEKQAAIKAMRDRRNSKNSGDRKQPGAENSGNRKRPGAGNSGNRKRPGAGNSGNRKRPGAGNSGNRKQAGTGNSRKPRGGKR